MLEEQIERGVEQLLMARLGLLGVGRPAPRRMVEVASIKQSLPQIASCVITGNQS